ncbi:MAG: hypothetical protein Kow0075_13270 [Salibacteraceae bacterium]
MKQTLLTLLTALIAGSFQAQVLYTQTNGSSQGAFAAQDFETTYDIYDCMMADDFIVPAGQTWVIDSVQIYGGYYSSSGFTTTAGINLKIYEDNNGLPGSQVFSYLNSNDLDGNGDGNIVAHFSSPIVLGEGHYWISAAARKNFGSGGGQYGIRLDSVHVGYPAKWRNPGGGFMLCTTWGDLDSCLNTTEKSMRFTMYGCSAPGFTPLGPDTAFCAGNSITLKVTSASSTATFLWNTGSTDTSITVSTSGTYTVTITDTLGACPYTGETDIKITVHPIPSKDLKNDTICEGEVKSFNGFINCNTCTYVWDDTVFNGFLTTGVPGLHVLKITNTETGCSGQDSVWLEVRNPSKPTLLPSKTVDLCEGESVYLSTAEAFASYWWSTGTAQSSIEVSDSGSYSVTVTDQYGCDVADTFRVNVNPLPEVSITESYNSNWVRKLSATPGFVSYDWSNGKSGETITVNTTGTYTVTVTDSNGCQGTASIFTTVGIESIATSGVLVYPNPTEGVINVQLDNSIPLPVRLRLADAGGRVIFEDQIASGNTAAVDLGGLQNGIYLLYLESGQGTSVVRITRQ